MFDRWAATVAVGGWGTRTEIDENCSLLCGRASRRERGYEGF